MIKQRIDQGGRIIRRVDSNGFVRVEGVVARVGIMEYYEDGKVVKEFVPPEVLFNQDSMNSLSGSPVTLQHPPELVNSSNYSKYSQGSVATTRQDGNNLIANLTIVGSEALNAVESGIDELSPGYAVELDETPGEWNGQRYDRKQTWRGYNHQAIVDAARGGRECRLNFDCAIAVIPENNDVAKVKLPNGETVDLSAENAVASIEAAFGTQSARVDSLRGGFLKLVKKHRTDAEGDMPTEESTDEEVTGSVESMIEALNSRISELEAKVDAMTPPANSNDKPEERTDAVDIAMMLSVIENARKLNPSVIHTDGKGKLKSATEIMAEALAENKKFNADKKADAGYVAAFFDIALNDVNDESLRKQRDGFNADAAFNGQSSHQAAFDKKFYEGKA